MGAVYKSLHRRMDLNLGRKAEKRKSSDSGYEAVAVMAAEASTGSRSGPAM